MRFFRKDLWETQNNNFFYRALRIAIASVQGFIEDKGFDKASTLTFYFLLSLIPLVAISFGIAQGLGFEDKFEEQVKSQLLQSQPQVAEKILEFSNATLRTTRGGIIAAFGIVVLVWTVLRMIGNIESFFDDIWRAKKTRTLWEQVKSYVPMILLFPIFLVGSSSILVYMSTTATSIIESVKFLSFLGPFVKYLFQLISYLVSWAFLSFIYIYLPNTKVSWKAGMIAGIITGLIYVIWQWIYVTFQVNAASYGAIYGSFAAIPLFLIWLNYSWLIIIFGAELTYHIQNEPMVNKKD
jgi:membrane protein